MAWEKGKAKLEPSIPNHSTVDSACEKWKAKIEPDTISHSAETAEVVEARLEPNVANFTVGHPTSSPL
eukprot:8336084-Pyramimonas_sp.AAC.1